MLILMHPLFGDNLDMLNSMEVDLEFWIVLLMHKICYVVDIFLFFDMLDVDVDSMLLTISNKRHVIKLCLTQSPITLGTIFIISSIVCSIMRLFFSQVLMYETLDEFNGLHVWFVKCILS